MFSYLFIYFSLSKRLLNIKRKVPEDCTTLNAVNGMEATEGLFLPPQEDRLFRKEERVVGCNLEGFVAGEEGVQWWKLVLVERCEFAVEEVGRETEYFGVHFQET